MATRSLIAIEKQNDVYDAVYCHFDGYLQHNGKVLLENYTTEEKVNELISKGEMSGLKETVDKCEFYTQRGEDLHVTKDISYTDLREKAQDMGCEYIYVFFPAEGTWQYSEDEDNFCSMNYINL
jgi:hypothetical protein